MDSDDLWGGHMTLPDVGTSCLFPTDERALQPSSDFPNADDLEGDEDGARIMSMLMGEVSWKGAGSDASDDIQHVHRLHVPYLPISTPPSTRDR